MTNEYKDIIAWIAIVVIGLAVIVFFIGKKDARPIIKINGATTSSNSSASSNNNPALGAIIHSQQSNVVSVKNIPSKAVRLTVTSKGFSPSSFTVNASKQITLSITSGDNQTYVFVFYNKALSGVAIGVGPGETRFITFKTPKIAGIYKFHSNMPGQSRENGEMIVK